MSKELKLKISKKVFNSIYIPYLRLAEPRTQIFYGGSSSGKSVFLAQRAVTDVVEGERNYLVTRKVQRTLRGSAFNEIIKVIDSFKLNEYFKINKSEMVITCFNGHQILFAGLDDTEKIKSITPAKGVITDIWIEESTEVERQDYKQLTKRLRGKAKVKKRISLSFNPILQDHWIYNDFFKGKWDETKNHYQDEEASILKTTYRDNKFLEEDDRKSLENETDPYFRNVYTEGNWGVLGHVIFKNWEVQDLSWLREIADNHKNGLDFGFGGDPAALVHTYHDKKRGIIYILDEFYYYELTNDVLATEVKKIIGDQYVVCDSAEPKSIKELKNFGVKATGAKKGKDSVNFGIDWLQRQKIIIDSSCQNAKNEFMKYKWKEDKDGSVQRVPVDKDNHIIDALRYAYENDMVERKIEFLK